MCASYSVKELMNPTFPYMPRYFMPGKYFWDNRAITRLYWVIFESKYWTINRCMECFFSNKEETMHICLYACTFTMFSWCGMVVSKLMPNFCWINQVCIVCLYVQYVYSVCVYVSQQACLPSLV